MSPRQTVICGLCGSFVHNLSQFPYKVLCSNSLVWPSLCSQRPLTGPDANTSISLWITSWIHHSFTIYWENAENLTANKREGEFGWEWRLCCWDKDSSLCLCDSLMGSKCGLLQGGCCCPSHLSADLCLEPAAMSFTGKVDSTSIFHCKPWKCQRGDQKPLRRNVPGVNGRGGGQWKSGDLHVYRVEGRGGGCFLSWCHSNSQTNCGAWENTVTQYTANKLADVGWWPPE